MSDKFIVPGRQSNIGVHLEETTLAEFKISDMDETTTTHYYGFINVKGVCYILCQDTVAGTFRYFKSVANYKTNWAGRASLTYGYFNEIFG